MRHVVFAQIWLYVCVCVWWQWQWQWEVPPVASFTVWQPCVCVFVHVTEQKVMKLTLWSHTGPCDVSIPQAKHCGKTLTSTYTTQQEINTVTPPCCSLLLSLPRLMRELLLLAEGLLLTPSRSQMIVFAAWGPDSTSADPVTGTVDLSAGFPLRVGHEVREKDNTAPQTPRVHVILNRLSFYLLLAAAVLD